VEQWQAYLEDPTLVDAILDRLIHNGYRLALKGDSMRKHKTVARTPSPPKTIDEHQELTHSINVLPLLGPIMP
jgi:hypothetical protein